MNFEYFIAKQLITAKHYKSSISAPIIKIAIAAIAIGMIMMLLSVATGTGLQQKIRDKVAAFNGHILISNYDNNQSQVASFPISIQQEFYPKFKTIQGIDHVQAVASKSGIIRTVTSFEGIVVKGVGADYNWKFISEFLVQGKLPNYKSNLNQQILISSYLANRLQLKLGDSFNTFFLKEQQNKLPNLRRFTIVGIFNSGFQDFDANYIIADIRHIQKLNKWTSSQVGSFEVFINDFNQIKQKADEIYQQTSATLDTKTIVEKYEDLFSWLKLFDTNILIILIIMILVATINMAVALLVLILERTQMIGILKAIGANNWSVRKIFLYNATYLIANGLFWGNIIAITLLLLQQHFGIIQLNPQNYYVTQAPVQINMLHILAINLLTITTCLIFLLIPSFIITKISPVKAINFD